MVMVHGYGYVMISWYDTARAASDAIAFTIPGKLSKISSCSKPTKSDPMN